MYKCIYQFNICIPSARTSWSSNSNNVSSKTFGLLELYVHVTKVWKLWLSYWLSLQAWGYIFASLNFEQAHNWSSINPVNGIQPSPLYIYISSGQIEKRRKCKYSCWFTWVHKAYRPTKHDQWSNRVNEYLRYFKPSILIHLSKICKTVINRILTKYIIGKSLV